MNALVAMPQFSMSDIERVARAIAMGGLFGSSDPNAVLTLCLLAQAEGQHPAVVFRDYHIIQGKPAKKADAMLRDFIVGGGKVEWHTLDDECADATFSHPAGGTVRIAWDKARVLQAQLGGNAMHKKYPRQMLRARVISEGVRTVYPGATSGLYVPEEAAAFDSPSPADTEGKDPPSVHVIVDRGRAGAIAKGLVPASQRVNRRHLGISDPTRNERIAGASSASGLPIKNSNSDQSLDIAQRGVLRALGDDSPL